MRIERAALSHVTPIRTFLLFIRIDNDIIVKHQLSTSAMSPPKRPIIYYCYWGSLMLLNIVAIH
jgi:hypothetical protein